MTGGRRARRVRQVLVVVELGLATILLTGSGLLLHSLMRMQAIDPGYQLQHVLLAGVAVPSNEYTNAAVRSAYYRELQQRVATLPGVKAVGISSVAPFGGGSHVSEFRVHGRQLHNPSVYLQTINDGFFGSLNIPILSGRGFNTRDTANSRPVVIIDQKLAHVAFPDGHAVGQQMRVFGQWRTVVGVVPTVKIRSLSQSVHRGTAYAPLTQGEAMGGMSLMIETTVPPGSLVHSLHEAVRSLDPAVALYNVETIHHRMLQTLDQRQATMNLILIFGGIALALAFVGVYGVLSYAVRQRTTECGVRLALGAQPRDLLWLILRDGLRLLAFGMGIGLALAVALGFVASSQLFGVAPYDPLTLIGVAVVLSAATLIACYLPARRAAKLDPATAMME